MSELLNCKVVCTEAQTNWMTKGKVYEFKNGTLVF